MSDFGMQLFIPHYHPVIDLNNNKTVKYESLARFFDAMGHAVGPRDIPELFNNEDFLRNIFIRSLSMAQAHAQEEKVISVNIHGISLDETFIEIISSIPETLRRNIQFEIAEKNIDCKSEKAAAIINKTREIGFSFALDDFGARGGSLYCLKKIHFDTVKIDTKMLSATRNNESFNWTVRELCDFAEKNNIELIACKIESEKDIVTANNFGIILGQGYLFGHPRAEIKDETDCKQSYSLVMA